MSKQFNGHHCWNCWNVSLWISNDEGLYRFALDCIKNHKRLNFAVMEFLSGVNRRTPDGAKYTHKAVYSALKGLSE